MPRYQRLRIHIKEFGGFFYIVQAPRMFPRELLRNCWPCNTKDIRHILLVHASCGHHHSQIKTNEVLQTAFLRRRWFLFDCFHITYGNQKFPKLARRHSDDLRNNQW